jgi:RNA polymerase sigma factor (sigma-70 family)
MRPTEAQIATLAPHIRNIAYAVGRYFPKHILDAEDLQQEGWIGVMSVEEKPHESEEELLAKCKTAAYRKAIDALRRIRDVGPTVKHVKSLGLLVDNIEEFEKNYFSEEHEKIEKLDLLAVSKYLSLQEKTVFWGLLADYKQVEIADMLHLTEGRVAQIKDRIFTYLRSVY